MLGERLDAQLDEARDGIGRRVEQAGVEAQLQTLDDRYAMLRAEAAFDHNDPDKIESLAMVAEQAAAHEARLGGHDDPGALASERRNAVWRSAIEANLAKGQPREALALYDRSKGSLGETMTTEMKDVATDVEAEDWVRRQEGAPTQETAESALNDPDLSPAARRRAYQKVQAEIVSTENARVAEVERLDAAVTTATKDLATDPSRFKRGTLASLADGYQKADETDTAALLRAQAEQESFLRGYAQSPAQAQQRILDTLPESEDRTLLEQIGKHQADAFDKDPWSAGTSIYPDVGAPKPLSDIGGRLDQARLISRHRGGIEVLPFSGGEISTLRKNIPAAPPQQQTDTLKELASLPPEILSPLASALAGKNGSNDFQSRSLAGALSFHADGAPEIADQVLRGAKLTQEKGDAGKPVIVTTQEWNSKLRDRLGDSGPVPPIVRDTIANIYTHNAERAGQGGEVDHDLLDKAIDITKDNIARQPEIMLMPYVISPDALNGGNSDVMLTPYAITPEAADGGDNNVVPVKYRPANAPTPSLTSDALREPMEEGPQYAQVQLRPEDEEKKYRQKVEDIRQKLTELYESETTAEFNARNMELFAIDIEGDRRPDAQPRALARAEERARAFKARPDRQPESDGKKNRLIVKPVPNPNPVTADIQWELKQPSKRGGFIVQRIERDLTGGKKEIFWEAWEVEKGEKVPRGRVRGIPDDYWRIIQYDPAFKGQVLRGWARFYEGMTLDQLKAFQFKLGGGKAGAIEQYGTHILPRLPLENATPRIRRKDMVLDDPGPTVPRGP